MNSNVDILPYKILDANGVGSSYNLIGAIQAATQAGAKVINISLGTSGDPATDPICQAITEAKNAGVVTVVAA